MTVAVGIVSPSFVVLAADSLEGWTDGSKRHVPKIDIGLVSRRVNGQLYRGRIAVTGAGGSDYLAYLKSRIIGQVEKRQPSLKTFVADTQQVVEAELGDFYTNHFAHVAHIDSHRLGEPSLLVAARFKEQLGLWRTHGSTVRFIPWGHDAVGVGAPWAFSVLDGSVSHIASERAATLAACYAVFQAKEHVDGCGKETHVISLRDGGRLLLAARQDAVHAAEAIFAKYNALQDEMLNAIITPPNISISVAPDERLTAMRAELSAIDFFPSTRLLSDADRQ